MNQTNGPIALLNPAPAWVLRIVCEDCLNVGFACTCEPSEAELLAECASICPGGEFDA